MAAHIHKNLSREDLQQLAQTSRTQALVTDFERKSRSALVKGLASDVQKMCTPKRFLELLERIGGLPGPDQAVWLCKLARSLGTQPWIGAGRPDEFGLLMKAANMCKCTNATGATLEDDVQKAFTFGWIEWLQGALPMAEHRIGIADDAELHLAYIRRLLDIHDGVGRGESVAIQREIDRILDPEDRVFLQIALDERRARRFELADLNKLPGEINDLIQPGGPLPEWQRFQVAIQSCERADLTGDSHICIAEMRLHLRLGRLAPDDSVEQAVGVWLRNDWQQSHPTERAKRFERALHVADQELAHAMFLIAPDGCPSKESEAFGKIQSAIEPYLAPVRRLAEATDQPQRDMFMKALDEVVHQRLIAAGTATTDAPGLAGLSQRSTPGQDNVHG